MITAENMCYYTNTHTHLLGTYYYFLSTNCNIVYTSDYLIRKSECCSKFKNVWRDRTNE